MSHHDAPSIAAKEQIAYASNEYIAHLDAIKKAVFQDELMRAQREAAVMKIEAWRSQSANLRPRI